MLEAANEANPLMQKQKRTRAILLALAKRYVKNGQPFPQAEELAGFLGITSNAISRNMVMLRNEGVVVTKVKDNRMWITAVNE